MVLWIRFPVGAGSSHTKDYKNGSGPCLHGTRDEVGTTKHNWSARCQYNVKSSNNYREQIIHFLYKVKYPFLCHHLDFMRFKKNIVLVSVVLCNFNDDLKQQ